MTTSPGHRALRIGRHSQPGGIYLVTFATHHRRRVFAHFRIGCAACRTFQPSVSADSATLLCWVLMPDHFHGLIRLDGATPLSRAVHRLKSGSSRACTAAGATRPLWARAFHDHALRRDEDMVETARYVIANPVRARFVERVCDYPFWNAAWL
jgi:REP element-mobilizing transposase RayT